VDREKCAQASVIPLPALDRGLAAYVIFTNFEETRLSLSAANRLAHDLSMRLVVMAAQVVPYPVPLDDPPVSTEFTRELLMRLVRGVEAEIKLYLCRDRNETIRHALPRGSVVVIGTRKHRWWDRDHVLARQLRRDGHQLMLIDTGRVSLAEGVLEAAMPNH